MLKTVNEIIKAACITDGSRTALLYRIRREYKIEPANKNYKLFFTEEDFNKIVECEIKRKTTFQPGKFTKRNQSMYQYYRNTGYSKRLTYYGGIN